MAAASTTATQRRLRALGAQLPPAAAPTAAFVDAGINISAKTIVLTGANRGLGLEFVRQYAACPADVRLYACCRKPADAAELNELAAASAGLITCHALDVTSAESVAALAAELEGVAIDGTHCQHSLLTFPRFSEVFWVLLT